MQCPLCREQVSDENQLQVHYLMSCSGYVEETSANKTSQVSGSTKVQFRWVKSKPTLTREVYLISSLAESIKLNWSEDSGCFLSEPTDTPEGQHACQLLVDEELMSTEDFEVTDESRVINVVVSEASLAGGSTKHVPSSENHDVHPPSPMLVDSSHQSGENRETEERKTQTGERPLQKKGSLYEELIQHQILHGDSLDENGYSLQTGEGKGTTNVKIEGNGLVQEASGSNDFQQFLQPSVTGDDRQETVMDGENDGNDQNSNPELPENGEVTTEERASSVSVHDSAEFSCSLSSHEDLETRPVLLGSNGENNDQQLEVNADDARDHTPVLNGHDHEQIAEASDPEEAPDTHDHEEILNAHDPEPVPEPDDSTAIANVPEQPSTPDAHVDIPDNPSPVSDPGDHGSVEEDDRPLLEERERPSGNVTSKLLPTEISSVPSISGREPVGGNDETTRYDTGRVDDLIFGNGNNPVPSAPTISERGRISADLMGETWPQVTDADGSLKESGRYPLLDDLQTDTLTRRSPAGSIFGDQEIRRPPLYTSAPSRPFSPLSYTRQDYSVISPLVSPRDSELNNESGNDRSVTRTSRPGPNGGTLHDHSGLPRTELTSTTSLQRLMDRQSPAGSVRSYGSSPRITGNYQPAESQPWSVDKLRELLDSLKQPQKRTNGHSNDSVEVRSKRPEDDETTALRSQIKERENYIKKLETKTAAYGKEIVKLRAKEMELAKALSLAETSRAAAKEQEDVVRQLTQALNTKEVECTDLERKILDMKQAQRLLQTEMESTKVTHDLRVKELKSVNNSLAEQLNTLRQDSFRYSPVYLDKYKKLDEEFMESRAVNASLQDQVKLLEKEKWELRRKLEIMSKQMEVYKAGNASIYGKTYYSSTNDGASERMHEQSKSPPVNGYLGTSESRFISRRQSDGEATIRQDSGISGNYDIRSFRNGHQKPTGSSSKISGTDHGEVRVQRHDDYSPSLYSQFATESYLPVRDFTTGVRRRKTSIDGAVSSDVSDIDVSRYLSTRSYSSDSITSSALLQNGWLESYGSQGRGKSRERQALDNGVEHSKRERKKRQRPHTYHSGSYENLPGSTLVASRSRSTPTSRGANFSVRGYQMDVSPSSPDSSDVAPQSSVRTSPRKGTPFAPSTPQEIDQGMEVLVTRTRGKIGRGKVKYIGYLPSKSDTVYLGLELDREDGKHDGKFNGQRFFKCKPNHGIFVPFDKVVMAYT